MSGCATTGPMVCSMEIRRAEDELRLKAVNFQYRQLAKISSIGYKINKNLPEEDKKGNFPFIGVYCSPIDKELIGLYNLQQKNGIAAIVVVENGPACEAGIQAGDIIDKADGKNIRSVSDLNLSIKRAKPGETVFFEIIRNGEKINKEITVSSIPVNVSYEMDWAEEVNAGAGPNKVVVTYGLMRFVKSDDEIAVILGHELAHITKGHLNKSAAGQVLGAVAAIGLGITSEIFAPGTGGAVMRGVGGVGGIFNRSYSQDLEREADYFGIQYVYNAGYDIDAGAQVWERFAIEVPGSMVRSYLSTHPSSPERYVRLKKAVEEIKSSGIQRENEPYGALKK